MSKHSLKFVIKEDKFNLKTIIYLFILIDLFLIPFGLWLALWYLMIYQASIIVGLMIGLRGMNKYKLAMGELQSIARDKSLTVDQREHMLVQGIHHYCLELGTIYMERLDDYKKKLKNLKEVIKRMDDFMLKEIMRFIAGIWAGFGLIFLDILIMFELRPLWITGLVFIFYIGDFFFWLIMEHYYGIFKEEIEPIQIGEVAVIKGKIAEIETKLQ